MSSLTAFDRLPQLRMIPVSGTPLFRYERRLSNRWVPCNHSRAVSIVGVYNRRAKRLCANLIEGSKTTAECQSVLSAGSQKHSALSICVMATRTNASAHLSISGKSSGR
nr:MAG TPA: hypothetical protein [Caudoviricetes sp.]